MGGYVFSLQMKKAHSLTLSSAIILTTCLVMAGVDLRTVAQLMGHKTIQITMRHGAPGYGSSAESLSSVCDDADQHLEKEWRRALAKRGGTQ